MSDIAESSPAGDFGRDDVSEQDIREYTRRVRALPVEQVIRDTWISILDTAQVKIGRRDARLLIDIVAVSLAQARGYLTAELATQMDGLLGQLRFAQVAAEGRAGQPGEVEENDLARVPAPPVTSPATTPRQ